MHDDDDVVDVVVQVVVVIDVVSISSHLIFVCLLD
jgi:hypothetical protein